jgi:tetratricopeptide (TPR) repeat protein
LADSANKPSAGPAGKPSAKLPARQRLGELWQLPALVLAGGLLVAGAVYAMGKRPKTDFDPFLAQAEQQIAESQAPEALALLNEKVLPFLGRPALSNEQGARLQQLVARAIYVGQKAKDLSLEVNNKNIIDTYADAEKRGAQLTSSDQFFLGLTHVAMGNLDAAMERVGKLPAESREQRTQVLQAIIEKSMEAREGGTAGDDRALHLTAELLADPELPVPLRAWATARQAEIRLSRGFADEAITRLLQAVPRLSSAEPRALGEIYLLLGRAYMETRAVPQAEAQFKRARDLIPSSDMLSGRVLLALAGVEESKGDAQAARELYAQVLRDFGDTPAFLPAKLGEAEVLAVLGATETSTGEGSLVENSIESFQVVVDRLVQGQGTREVTGERVGASLMARFRDRFEAGDTARALRFALMAELLTGSEKAPADVLLAIATSRRKLADETIATAQAEQNARRVVELDPATQATAQQHLIPAGQYFAKYAEKVLLSDAAAYGRALWDSADCFDRAGDQTSAIDAFRRYIKEFPLDPRTPEAVFRVAQASQSRGELPEAIALYEELIKSRDERRSTGVGPYADASYVPLAQCYLADANPDNDQRAEELLDLVLSGTIVGPQNPNYRAALLEMGELYYRTGRYERAIERLQSALEIYPGDPREPSMRFRLGDSFRMRASAIDRRLTEAMPDSERRTLETDRAAALREAMTHFATAREGLEKKDARRRSGVEELQLRNAYFYEADAAFDLGEYELAIRKYNAARERSPRDPASLVAMTQVVACHLKLGDTKRAATANERARRFYQSLPAEVWNDPNLPMSRKAWETWLDATATLTGAENTEDARASVQGTSE